MNVPDPTGTLSHEVINHDLGHLQDILRRFSDGEQTVAVCVKSSLSLNKVHQSGLSRNMKIALSRSHRLKGEPVRLRDLREKEEKNLFV